MRKVCCILEILTLISCAAVESLMQLKKYSICISSKCDIADMHYRLKNSPRYLILHLARTQYYRDNSTLTHFQQKLRKKIVFPQRLHIATKEYTLSSVIVHQGSTTLAGHYICLIQTCADKW